MEKELWERFIEGDEETFNFIYNRHAEILFAYGMKIVGDRELVNECIQELFIYLYEHRKSISRPKDTRAYLLASMRRQLYRGRKYISKFISIDPNDPKSFNLHIDIADTMEHTDLEECKLTALQKALDMLSPQQREVLYLRYYKNLSVDQTAEVIGISRQTVMNVACTALSKMRKNDLLTKGFLLAVVCLIIERIA